MTQSIARLLFNNELKATRDLQEALGLLGIRHTVTLPAVLGALEHSIAHPSKTLTGSEELQLCIAMQSLGYFSHQHPPGTKYDYLLWPGDHIDFAAHRLAWLIDCFSDRIAKHVVVLTSTRKLTTSETPSAVNRAMLFHRDVEESFDTIRINDVIVRTEEQAMFWLAAKTGRLLSSATLPGLKNWMFIRKGKPGGSMPDFSDRLSQWLTRKPEPGKVFVASSQPFEAAQHLACQLLLPSDKGWKVDVAGCHCLPHDLPVGVLIGELTNTIRVLSRIWAKHGTLDPEQQPTLST